MTGADRNKEQSLGIWAMSGDAVRYVPVDYTLRGLSDH